MRDEAFRLWRRQGRRWLPLAGSLVLYGVCIGWLLYHAEEIGDVLALSWATLGFLLFAVVLQYGVLLPERFRLLLSAFKAQATFSQARRDRLFCASVRLLGPVLLSDPLGLYSVTRRYGFSARKVSRLWFFDKFLTLLGLLTLAAGASVFYWSGRFELVLVGTALIPAAWFFVIALDLSWKIPLLEWAIPTRQAWREQAVLLLWSLMIEGVEMLAFAGVLMALLPGPFDSFFWLAVVVIHVVASLPITFGGSGSREAATLWFFHGHGHDPALFLAAFAGFLTLRVAPALWGARYARHYLVSSVSSGGRD